MKCAMCFGLVDAWFSHDKYPIFNGCSDNPREQDETFTFQVGQCIRCGLVQQMSQPPLDVLYREPRAFGYGKVWQGHYAAFGDFVGAPGGRVLEIGGGNGVLLARTGATEDVEPNPQYIMPNVTTHRDYFQDFVPKTHYDAVYCSHLIEHVVDPLTLFERVSDMLTPSGSFFTACPDFNESLGGGHLNAFTPDHFNYFTPQTLAELALKAGLVAVRFQKYRDHGMYFEFRRVGQCVLLPREDLSWETYRSRVESMAQRLDRLPDNTFLYGAHTFTISMLRFAANPERFQTVLDNEPTKHYRRLTGTRLRCDNPWNIEALVDPIVALYMGAYNDEIEAALRRINPSVRVVRL